MNLNIRELIKQKQHILRQKGVDVSVLELELLLARALNTGRQDLLFYRQDITPLQIHNFEDMLSLRAKHCPVDKILKIKGFYKNDFVVTQDVLSPRYDTEILVEKAVYLLKNQSEARILEFGIGSGCIILSILDDLPQTTGIGVDISAKAIDIAKLNAQKLGVEQRIKFVNLSWFDDKIHDSVFGPFDLIISNPPYIPSSDIPKLSPEVKYFDPLIALDGGQDGLRDYRRIAKIAPLILKEGGFLIFEVGCGQAQDVISIGQNNGFTLIEVAKDLAGIERCIILKK